MRDLSHHDLTEALELFNPRNDISVQMATVEHREKPSYPNEDGTIWGARPTTVTKDASGRIIAERLGEIR